MQKLKDVVLRLGAYNNKLGIAIIALMVVLLTIVAVRGSKPAYFDWLAYPPMVLYCALPYLCDKIRGEDAEFSQRRMFIGFVIVFCLLTSLH